MLGREIGKWLMPDKTELKMLDVSHVPNGAYVFTVQKNNENIYRQIEVIE